MLAGGLRTTNKEMSLFPGWIKEIPEHLRTQEMFDEAVRMKPLSLEFVPDHLKTQEMCNETVRINPHPLEFVPECF